MNNDKYNNGLKPVRITAMRQTVYRDLMQQFENPIEHTCDIAVGQTFVSVDAQRPEGLCESAWESMRPLDAESPVGHDIVQRRLPSRLVLPRDNQLTTKN